MALLLAGCSQVEPVATATASPTASPSTPSPGACQLPISLHPNVGSPQGAFVDIRSGRVTIDPRGDGGRYYDRRFARWLPVSSASVSTDGGHYASGGSTADQKAILHIVDVASGSDHVYSLPDELFTSIGGIHVFEYSNDMIYMGLDGEGYIAALWAFDLSSGVTRKVADITGLGVIDDKIAWRSTLDPTDSRAWSYVPGSPADQIERLDLGDGSHEVWLRRPGDFVGVIGVDGAHHPIVSDSLDKQTIDVMVLTSATTQQTIVKGSVETWGGFINGVASDSHGLWIGGDKGIYLYSPAEGLRKVTDQAGTLAGSCD